MIDNRKVTLHNCDNTGQCTQAIRAIGAYLNGPYSQRPNGRNHSVVYSYNFSDCRQSYEVYTTKTQIVCRKVDWRK